MVAAGATAGAVWLASAASGEASGHCIPNQQWGFWIRTSDAVTLYPVGSQRSGTLTGVRAGIPAYVPYLDGDSFQASTKAFVQLRNSPADRTARVGWENSHAWGWNRFSEVWDGLGYHYDHWPSHTSLSFRIEYTTSSEVTSLWIGGDNIKNTWLGQGVPNVATVAGMVNSRASQMPGGYLPEHRLHFQLVNRRDANEVWQPFSGTGFNSNEVWFGLNGVSTSSFEIWDEACAS